MQLCIAVSLLAWSFKDCLLESGVHQEARGQIRFSGSIHTEAP